MTPAVRAILANYESDNPGTKGNLARILMQGRLGGTGKLVILPVDQGFEHGPARSFAPNPAGYDPHYHWQLAIDAGLSAFASPLGMIEAGADTFAGQIPTILKLNSSNSWATARDQAMTGTVDDALRLGCAAVGFTVYPGGMIEAGADTFAGQIPTILKLNSSNSWATARDQAMTGTVDDALRLGCAAVGFTVYPGSESFFELQEEIAEMSAEAKSVGIATVLWSYPRGGELSKDDELGVDVGAYAAHMAALQGAHIIKVKLPSDHVAQKDAKKAYETIRTVTQADRVRHVVEACFAGRRMVVFSGGATKGADAVYQDARDIRDGGGNGSIIGRNTFQRPRAEALSMLDKIVAIYQGAE